MHLRYLETFAAAVDQGSFTKAARSQHLTQSAVSQQIKELEQWLGLPLFERHGRSTLPTDAARRFREQVGTILAQVQLAREEARGFEDGSVGHLAIGATYAVGTFLVPGLLKRLRQRGSKLRISVDFGTVQYLAQLLAWLKLDVVLTDFPLSRRDLGSLSQEPLADDEIVLVTRANHPWARSGLPIAPAQLRDVPLLLQPAPSTTRALVLRCLSEAGVDVTSLWVELELGNTEALKRAAREGLGPTFVSRYAVESELAALQLAIVPIAGVEIRRKLWCLTAMPEHRPSRAQRFREFLFEVFENFRLDSHRFAEALQTAGLGLEAPGATLEETRPDVVALLASSRRQEAVVETTVGSAASRQTIASLGLPGDCLAILLRRGQDVLVPKGDTRLAAGDRLTFLGRADAVEAARRQIEHS